MSEELIDGLRDDLVGAMERYERERRPLESFAPRPAALVRALAVAAAAVAVVIGVGTLHRDAPARPHVVGVLPIGGMPLDASLSGGTLWVSDFSGSLVGVDVAARRVAKRIRVPGQPEAISASEGSVWTQFTGDAHCGGDLLRYDAGSGRLLDRRRVPFPSEGRPAGGLVAGADGVWLKSCASPDGVARLRPGGMGKGAAMTMDTDGLDMAGGRLWVLRHDGSIASYDAAGGRLRHRWPQLAPLADRASTASHALAADPAGAWVLSTGRSALLRIERGRVVRTLAVHAITRPLLAVASDGLWVAATDRTGAANRLIRIDPRTGRQDAGIDLGTREPKALAADGDHLAVVTADGRVVFVATEG